MCMCMCLQLNSYGCSMESFLENLGTTEFSYEIDPTAGISQVSSEAPEVVQWYANLTACYTNYFNQVQDATSFMTVSAYLC